MRARSSSGERTERFKRRKRRTRNIYYNNNKNLTKKLFQKENNEKQTNNNEDYHIIFTHTYVHMSETRVGGSRKRVTTRDFNRMKRTTKKRGDEKKKRG